MRFFCRVADDVCRNNYLSMPQAILTAAQQCGFLILLFEFSSLRYYVYMERAEWIFHASTECLIN